MKKLPQSNIFSASAEEVSDLFRDYIEGPSDCIVLSLSQHPLGKVERNAIDKSLESFGYGSRACTYASLSPVDSETEGGDIPLDPQALFLLVEGLDPTCLICADQASADCLAKAFRTSFDTDAATRIFGRPAVVYRDLAALLDTERGKQFAWRLLKTLPKR